MMQKSASQVLLEEEERKKARIRIAQLESAERVKKYKKKEAKRKKAEEKKHTRVRSEDTGKEKLVYGFQPHEAPAYFDLSVEKRHLEHLGKKTLDKENRLQVIYRILKDQLRIHKKQLLQIKKENAAE